MSIRKLYIDPAVASATDTLAFQARLRTPEVEFKEVRQVYDEIAGLPDPVQGGKAHLLLTENRGAFIRKCPGTRAYNCCGYQILHIGTFCTMDCAYCILQAYFHPPVLQFFTNRADLVRELDERLAAPGISRIGTGEFTDSLIWEAWTDFTGFAVPRFAGQSRAVLELKTKTVQIDNLRRLDPNRKTIMAWSLNTERVIRQAEKGTAPLEARLEAAARAQSWGYPVAFHFDPIILYPGAETEYQAVIDRIFTHVSPDNIVWISLGTFRFMPALKEIIQDRFPDSDIIYGEFVKGLDGKMRYFKPLRIRIYQALVSRLRDLAPEVCAYFCMEDDETWRQVMGFTPWEKGGLPRILDESAVRRCGLDPAMLDADKRC